MRRRPTGELPRWVMGDEGGRDLQQWYDRRKKSKSLRCDGLIVDLDEVIWRGGASQSRAQPTQSPAIRAIGTRVLFLTSDPGISRLQLAARLIGERHRRHFGLSHDVGGIDGSRHRHDGGPAEPAGAGRPPSTPAATRRPGPLASGCERSNRAASPGQPAARIWGPVRTRDPLMTRPGRPSWPCPRGGSQSSRGLRPSSAGTTVCGKHNGFLVFSSLLATCFGPSLEPAFRAPENAEPGPRDRVPNSGYTHVVPLRIAELSPR